MLVQIYPEETPALPRDMPLVLLELIGGVSNAQSLLCGDLSVSILSPSCPDLTVQLITIHFIIKLSLMLNCFLVIFFLD